MGRHARRSPKLALFGNVFRVDQLPNHGSLGLPDGYSVTCANNTIVWLGHGAFPEAASWLAKCPDTQIVTSISTWNDAVAAWNGRALAPPRSTIRSCAPVSGPPAPERNRARTPTSRARLGR